MVDSQDREKEINSLLEKDSKFEGRDRFFMDIDRMVDGGLANGTVINRHDHKQIDETRNLEPEEPPLELE